MPHEVGYDEEANESEAETDDEVVELPEDNNTAQARAPAEGSQPKEKPQQFSSMAKAPQEMQQPHEEPQVIEETQQEADETKTTANEAPQEMRQPHEEPQVPLEIPNQQPDMARSRELQQTQQKQQQQQMPVDHEGFLVSVGMSLSWDVIQACMPFCVRQFSVPRKSSASGRAGNASTAGQCCAAVTRDRREESSPKQE